MAHEKVRTTSFRLKPEHFGQVYAYEAGERFSAMWYRLRDLLRGSQNRTLPHASLATALSVLSGDFVRVWTSSYFILSRRPLSQELLSRALYAWEHTVFPHGADGRLADAVEDLRENCLQVAERIECRAEACPRPDSWIWEVGGWEVAHRLASRPLRVEDQALRLRLDTGASREPAGLVTWDRPIEVAGVKGREAERAMVRIQPRLITIPGLSQPVIHLQSSVTRLSNKWGGWVKNGWANLHEEHPLLLIGIRHKRIEGDWQPTWADDTAAVLALLGLKSLPEPSTIDLVRSDFVRARVGLARSGFALGKGTGQMFHDVVAVHACDLLEGAEPVELSRAVRSLPRPSQAAVHTRHIDMAVEASGSEALRVVCLYATDETRRRMADAVAEMLQASDGTAAPIPADGQLACLGRVELLFVSPPGAAERLLQNGNAVDIERWIAESLPTWKQGARGQVAALIETVAEQDRREDAGDPKFILRRVLAKAGITSQFLSPSSHPSLKTKSRKQDDVEEDDHAAGHAVWDLLRSAGVFPRSFPALDERIPAGTWLLGLFCRDVKRSSTRGPKGSSKDSFAVSLVAVEAGTRQARALQPDRTWARLGVATAALLAEEKTLAWNAAIDHVESALSRFMAEDPFRKAVLFVEAIGCRRFWDGLADTGAGKLFQAVNTGRLAVVRVRSDDAEVPRPAGVGPWPEDGIVREPSTIEGLLRLAASDWEGARFYISPSRVMRRQGDHRRHTRFHEELSRSELRKDWHALTLTEFWCRHAGPFERDALYELGARLCREAPTWDGTLDWPSPVHLAKAILEDHPAKYFADFVADAQDGTSDS